MTSLRSIAALALSIAAFSSPSAAEPPKINPALTVTSSKAAPQLLRTQLEGQQQCGPDCTKWTKDAMPVERGSLRGFRWRSEEPNAKKATWSLVDAQGVVMLSGIADATSGASSWAYFNVTFGSTSAAKPGGSRVTPLLPYGEYRLNVGALTTAGKPLGKSSVPIAIKVAPSQAVPLTGLALNQPLTKQLLAIQEKYSVPALAGAVVTATDIGKVDVVGVRKDGNSTKATVDDRWHLGSDTKAMTATLVGILVERGQHGLKWQTTLAEVFPEWSDMDPEFKTVTLEQLAAHRAGVFDLPASTNAALYSPGLSVVERRRAYTHAVVKGDAVMPGEQFSYHNGNFIILGAVLEKKTGKQWETLIKDELFTPLGMKSAGFGAPGVGQAVDAPWGHSDSSGQRVPTRGDNPPELGPAGTVHASLSDWARFIRLHLTGSEGSLKLAPSTLQRLHQQYKTNVVWPHTYGWGWIHFHRGGLGRGLAHDGSNGAWYCSAWLFPEKKVAVLAVTNIGSGPNGNGGAATADLNELLLKYAGF